MYEFHPSATVAAEQEEGEATAAAAGEEEEDAPSVQWVPPGMTLFYGAWRDQKQRKFHLSPSCPLMPATALRLNMPFFDIPPAGVCDYKACQSTYTAVPRWLYSVLMDEAAAGGGVWWRKMVAQSLSTA